MGALKKATFVTTELPLLRVATASAPNQALYRECPVDSPEVMIAFPWLDPPDYKWFAYRNICKTHFYNCSAIPVMMECTWVKARRSLEASDYPSLSDLMQVDGPLADDAYISPFSGHSFLRYFKILRTKKRWVQPQRQMTFKTTRKYPAREWTTMVDGDTKYTAVRGNIFMVQRFWGMPIYNANPDLSMYNTYLGPVNVTCVIERYLSFWRNDDNHPRYYNIGKLSRSLHPQFAQTSVLPSQFVPVVPSTVPIYNATGVQAVHNI
jgi:hypothetical protein